MTLSINRNIVYQLHGIVVGDCYEDNISHSMVSSSNAKLHYQQNQSRLNRKLRFRCNFFYLSIFLIATLIIPIFQFGSHHSTTVVTQQQESSFDFYHVSCPKGVNTSIIRTKEQCIQRYQEWQKQLFVEDTIKEEMISWAKHRAIQNEYHRQHINLIKKHHDEHWGQIQHVLTLANNVAIAKNQYKPLNSNWTIQSSFPDINIIGFPKAGTSHLYNLLISHPDTARIYKRKEFCVDHGHFLDYSTIQQPEKEWTDENSLKLHKKLWNYHRRVYAKKQQVIKNITNNNNNNNDNNSLKRSHSSSRDHRNLPVFINACIQPSELPYHLAYMMQQQPTGSDNTNNITYQSPTERAMTSSSNSNNNNGRYNNNDNNNNNNNNKMIYIMLFRDPADWLWASWNFWFDRSMDAYPPIKNDWSSPNIQYRSPELFHELILSHSKLKFSNRRPSTMREQTVHIPRKLLYWVSKQREYLTRQHWKKETSQTNNQYDPQAVVHFFKAEDMQPERIKISGFLERLSDVTGLNVTKFDPKVIASRSNCNANKGYQHSCNYSSTNHANTVDGAYEITHHRPMLHATRQLIYLQFLEECKVWAEEFGIIYKDCLQASRK